MLYFFRSNTVLDSWHSNAALTHPEYPELILLETEKCTFKWRKEAVITANALISSLFFLSLFLIPPPPPTAGRKLSRITYSFISRQVAVQIWSYSENSSQSMQVQLFTTSRLLSLACMWFILHTKSPPPHTQTNRLQRCTQNTCWGQWYFPMTRTSHRCLAKIQNSSWSGK